MSGPIYLTRAGKETAFSRPLKRAVIREIRLSFGARGVFIFLWDFPDGWSFYISHIVNFSPAGVTQLRGYLRELREIGALQIIPRRITRNEAISMSSSKKTYKAGQILGQSWVLNHPDKWAIEAPLSKKPPFRFSEVRLAERTENPNDSSSTHKVFKHEGAPNSKKQLQEIDTQTVEREYRFPIQLNPNERKIAGTLLLKTDAGTAQQILDVLSEKLSKNKIRGAPLAYLQTLVQRANNGQFFYKPEVDRATKSKPFQVKVEKTPSNSRAKPEATAIEAHINNIFRTIGKSRNFKKSNLT
ncbi:hypothetical protein INP77_07670 [Methylophilus sp. 13]|uniref:hypothetical protein n=1 Tax=Methylophilus sp. 13 TaxID=2781018 RepID=UPI00188DDCF2|nr:hypothetical protein [Methylophilus sp. 13]MBF5039366.1 hypothetical protein [Methylophilus sp. 13]